VTSAELRAIRKRLELTQTELAERLGVQIRAVQRWEAGDRAISEPVSLLVQTFGAPKHKHSRPSAK
jgi:type I restriction enzyme M protein